jgi:NADH-quinone oxidoreductase subunit L
MLEKLRGVGRDRPKIFFGFTLAALALAGIPPLSGFFSKDAIIAALLNSNSIWILLPFALIGTVLTGSYMARALRLLWQKTERQTEQKTGSSQTVAGLAWMGAGLSGLVFLAVTLGAAFPTLEITLESLFKRNLTENINFLPATLGFVAAVSGLLLGLTVPVSKLMGLLLPWANRGFSIAGGFDNLMVRPAYAIAHSCEKLERLLYDGVLAIGRFGLTVAKVLRRNDEQGIDGFIFSFVQGMVNLGSKARTLQSGLIHKELAVTTIISAILFIFMFVALLVY